MPSAMFLNLDITKQDQIRENCISVFAEKGYHQASTNDMVKRTGISKGSIWHYFESKQELYFYCIQHANKVMRDVLIEKMNNMSQDPFERIKELTIAGLDVFIQYPSYYRLSLSLTQAGMEEILQKFISQHGRDAGEDFNSLFIDINDSYFKFSKKDTLIAMRWMYQGIKTEMLYNPTILPPQEFKEKFLQELDRSLVILKHGALHESRRKQEDV